MKAAIILVAVFVLAPTAACHKQLYSAAVQPQPELLPSQQKAAGERATPLDKVIAAAIEQANYTKSYDPAYTKIDYPNGDVPKETGVCADVIVRAFRAASIDLQKEVHEDMTANFAQYPKTWGARKPDRNIDHRRVGNLMKWFERQKKSLSVTKDAKNYLPGDVVAWNLGNGRLHIGLVTDVKNPEASQHLVAHNIGAGAQVEDVLFAWQVIGHYRYFQKNLSASDAPGPATVTGNLKVGFIRNEGVYGSAGCTLSFSNRDQQFVFFSEGVDEAIMNVDEQDIRLKLVSRRGRTERKGDKSVEIWRSGNLRVRVDYLITWACYPFNETCEGKGYSFDALITLNRGSERKTVKTTGGCGC
jgi:hypothetical protein